MKIILILVIIACFGAIGFGISRYYIQRKKFFSQLDIFMSSLELDISFSQTRLIELIDKQCKTLSSAELILLCENYKQFLQSKEKPNQELFKELSILKPNEKELLLSFFTNLGRFDATNQSKEINKFGIKFKEIYEEAKIDYSKYSTLFIKLGIIVGLLLCLIII